MMFVCMYNAQSAKREIFYVKKRHKSKRKEIERKIKYTSMYFCFFVVVPVELLEEKSL